ncbi:MAG: TonB-dependent receptor [Caulobacteraceae bacterium]|nr:TonB-dependent receptor [Caulobacteraceae bacterium]
MTALGLLTGLCGAAAAAAEPAPPPAPVDEVVVTATRRSEGIRALESPVPIDVISGQALAQRGYSDLSRDLQFSSPSVNFNRAATTATAASTRPVTLRGLSPDQVLVLVNGKRRHASAILNTNNSIGRGAAPVDFNLIPEAAIERVEILRDGAAAQYGSDAIAGVVNVILRSDAAGAMIAGQGGATGEGDGANGMLTARAGLALGDGGHLTLTGQARHQEPTNRANVDQRFGRVTYEIGDPRLTEYELAIDAAYPLRAAGELYLFGTAGYRDALSPSGYRIPTTAPALYPEGYVSHIHPHISDAEFTGGWRGGGADGWRLDLSDTLGWDLANFSVQDSVNLSLIAAGRPSPTRFDAGGVTYIQNVSDALLTRRFDVLQGLNLAFGAQGREEWYKIRDGEPLAYFGAGADGFPGFQPRNPVDKSRTAYAGFADIELDVLRQLQLGAALRYDHYSDFGGAVTWKTTARFAPTAWLALRAAAGSGFRAPSMQQQYFSAVTNNLSSTGALVTVGTLPVDDPVAKALGAAPLKAERSRNWTAGLVLTPGAGFSFSADWFHIAIRDRIALSEQLAGAPVTAILRSAGITQFQQVRFFTNALDTHTRGLELSGQWSGRLGEVGRLDLSLGYGRFVSSLDRLRPNTALPGLPLLATKSLVFVLTGQPRDKLIASAGFSRGPFSFQAAATRFGVYQGADLATLQTYGAKTLVDLTAGWRVGPATLRAGVLNVGDVRPDQPVDNRLASIIAATGGSFPAPEEAPFGFNGRSWYVGFETAF